MKKIKRVKFRFKNHKPLARRESIFALLHYTVGGF